MGKNGYNKTALLALGGFFILTFSSIVCILPDRAFHMQDIKNDLCLKLRPGNHDAFPNESHQAKHRISYIFPVHPSKRKHCTEECKLAHYKAAHEILR